VILTSDVRDIGEKHIKQSFSHYAATMSVILDPEIFTAWCRICAERVNQLDMAGTFKSRTEMARFIQEAARVYANVRLASVGKVPMSIVTKDKIDQ